MADDTGTSNLEEFNEKIESMNFQGQWKAIANEGGGLQLASHVWKWDDILDVLTEAEDVVSLDEQPQGARRSIGLRNPAFSSGNQTSRTVNVGVQMVQPDEVARAHRHTITAFRFVISGNEDAYTNVEGEQFPMRDGDLILTPRMAWHDHVNNAEDPVIWLDGLDVPLIKAIGAADFENFRDDRQDKLKPTGYARSRYGLLRPESDDSQGTADVPPYRFPWEETYEALKTAEAQGDEFDPYNGVRLEYVNPKRGSGPALETLSLFVQLCPADAPTATHRHNSTEIYHVVQGSGRTTIGGEALEWAEGDCFIVPPDRSHSHQADDGETILFCVSDRPIFEGFGIHREEAEDAVYTTEAETNSPVSQQG